MSARQVALPTKSWSARFRERRLELDLSQDQISQTAQITQQAISRFEHGLITPRFSTLDRLAKAVGMTREELFPMEAAPRSKPV